jgi:hypothetical protein
MFTGVVSWAYWIENCDSSLVNICYGVITFMIFPRANLIICVIIFLCRDNDHFIIFSENQMLGFSNFSVGCSPRTVCKHIEAIDALVYLDCAHLK